MKKVLGFLFIIILLSGCSSKGSANISFNCNDVRKNHTIKKDSVLKCEMMGFKYELTVKEIEDDKIIIISNSPLSTVDGEKINPNSTQVEFEIKKGKTELAVPMDGFVKKLDIKW